MTEQQYKEAGEISKKIITITNKINKLNDLMERVRQITGYGRSDIIAPENIGIQIAEQYWYTPQPEVNIETFMNFLLNEMDRLKVEKEELESRFEKL